MILRSALLACCGCAGALAMLHLAPPAPHDAPHAAEPEGYAELPLVAVPRIANGRTRGYDLLRVGVVAAASERDPGVQRAMLLDAIHEAALGDAERSPNPIAPTRFKAAIRDRLAVLDAPFAVSRIALLHVEHRKRSVRRAAADKRVVALP